MASILLADDDASVRELVRRALTQDGHTVTVTEDGAEALQHLSAHAASIDVVVSDVNMPQIDGVTLAQKAVAIKPSIAVVLMSGFSEQLDRASAIKAGKLAVISKPFTLEQIKSKVRAVLG
jgi:CheY-like chemotaxis protein